MRKKSLDDLQIGQISDVAGVSRNTLYYHFSDKYEILDALLKSQLVPVVQPLLTRESWARSLEAAGSPAAAGSGVYDSRPAHLRTGQFRHGPARDLRRLPASAAAAQPSGFKRQGTGADRAVLYACDRRLASGLDQSGDEAGRRRSDCRDHPGDS